MNEWKPAVIDRPRATALEDELRRLPAWTPRTDDRAAAEPSRIQRSMVARVFRIAAACLATMLANDESLRFRSALVAWYGLRNSLPGLHGV